MDKLKILVVDDESRMRKLVRDFLVRSNFEVIEAEDGAQALDIFFEQQDIALILLDVMMPKMDGWQVCREIRKNSKVPIIMLTAKGEDMDKIMGTTMSGPHRDKIYFVREGKQYIPSASTGQRRLISIILRIAQAKYFSEITYKKPILLMDDVLLELDPNKRQSVTALLPEYDQLFCTFLPGEPYDKYKHSTTRIYKIENGAWYE